MRCLEYIVRKKKFWSPKLLWSLPLLWVHLSRVWSRIQPLFNCFGFIANNNQPVDHDVPDFQKLVIPHNHIPSIWISSHYFYCHSSARSDLTCQEVSHPHFPPLLLWHQHCADSPKNISLRSTGQRTVQNSWGEINISTCVGWSSTWATATADIEFPKALFCQV